MTIWYMADPHFDHWKINELSKRGFSSVEEMNDKIVEGVRSVVKDGDTLWILGDFAHDNKYDPDNLTRIFKRLPGRKFFLPGNHDSEFVLNLPWANRGEFQDIVEFKEAGRNIVLSHYPLLTWNGARKHSSLNLFGHVHNNWLGSRNSVNVGVDCWNFRPTKLTEIDKRAESLPVNPLWDVVEPGLTGRTAERDAAPCKPEEPESELCPAV